MNDISLNDKFSEFIKDKGFKSKVFFYHILKVFPTPSTPKIPAKNEAEIRIVTYNLKNAYSVKDPKQRYDRIEQLATQINDYKPDLLGMQEADAPWMGEDENFDCSISLPNLLEDYAFIGQARGDDTGEYAPLFYLKDKFTVIDSGSFWFSDTPEIPSRTWGSGMNRICTWAMFKDNKSQKIFTHFNTHFDSKKQSHFKATALLLEKIKQFDTPIIMTGDFNMYENCCHYKKIVKSNFEDAKKVAKTSMSHGTLNCFKPYNCRFFAVIDFVFFQKGKFKVNSYQIDNTYRFGKNYISDHFPLVVGFEFKD